MVVMYKKLLKKVAVVNFTDKVAIYLTSSAKSTLKLFPVAAEGTSIPPEEEDVAMFMRDMLPPPLGIFTDQFFCSPLFPIVLLHDVAEFYGFSKTEDTYIRNMNRMESEKSNEKIISHVWISWFMECTPSTAHSIVNKYKNTHGSSNTLLSRPPSFSTASPLVAKSVYAR